MDISITGWILFHVFVVGMLAIDLFIFHRHAHEVNYKEAVIWTVVWIVIALLFCLGIYFFSGSEPALNFLAGYLIEKSLSVDNLFVFLMLFSYFRVPKQYLHTVLFWGVLGALVMRALFIFGGILLIQQFHWIIYVFGAFLIIAGIKLALNKDKAIDPINNPVLIFVKKIFPITHEYHGKKFFIRHEGKVLATPLFIVLIAIETTDIVFAFDSVPAILAITTDPFIAYTSNVFAILGLRALYFVLSGLMDAFHYLQYGLAFLLVFIGFKMLVSNWIHIPVTVALLVILLTLIISIAASLLISKPEAKK